MKKNLAKIFATCSVVVAIILIMVLLVTAFGGIQTNEFDSKLVQGLLLTLTIVYIALSAITLVLLFIKSDSVSEIVLRAQNGGTVKISAGVVTKQVKAVCKQVEGVKCKKVAVVADDFGNRLKVNVKVVDKDVLEAEAYLRALIEDVFEKECGFRFNSIEIKVMALQSKYQADQAEINAKVEQKLAEIKAEQSLDNVPADEPKQEKAQQSVENAVSATQDAPAEVAENGEANAENVLEDAEVAAVAEDIENVVEEDVNNDKSIEDANNIEDVNNNKSVEDTNNKSIEDANNIEDVKNNKSIEDAE